MNGTITLEEFAKHAKELRSRYDQAERELMEYLMWAEGQDFWRAQFPVFADVIEYFSICKVSRFERFKAMTAGHGAAAADVSVNALMEAGKFEEPAAQREVLEQAAKWEETNETPISPQSAATIGRDLRARMAAMRTGNKSYQTVVSELETAKREIGRLTEENKNLRLEIADLKRQRRAADSAQKSPKRTIRGKKAA